MRHYGECLRGTGSFYGFGKKGHKVRDFPNIASRRREGKDVASGVPKDDVPTKRCFYALWIRGSRTDENDHDEGKSLRLL